MQYEILKLVLVFFKLFPGDHTIKNLFDWLLSCFICANLQQQQKAISVLM